MRNPECPNQDGPITADPYGAGVVECVSCALRYHHPCARVFTNCAGCGTPLRTKRVFSTGGDDRPASPMRSTRSVAPSSTRVTRMTRKPRPGSLRDRLVRAGDALSNFLNRIGTAGLLA